MVKGQSRQKVNEIPSQQKKAEYGGMNLLSQPPGRYKKEDRSSAQPGQKCKTLPQKTKAKRSRGMVQMVEHLPSKCKALSSNTNTTKNK
jgi:hypothetical protein